MKTHEWRRRIRRLTRELQTLTGGAPLQVVLDALEHRHRTLSGPASPDERLAHALAELQQADAGRARRCPRPPTHGEIGRALGYGPEGV